MSKRLCALSRLAGDAPAGLVMLAVLACLAAAVAVLGPDAGAETLREALANAIGRAPHIGLDAGQRGWPIELQHKELLLVDRLMGAGPYALHKRANTIKLIAFSA